MGALIALVICSLGLQIFAHEHHHHEHEDDEIARGKSKWFKQPEEVVHKHHDHDHGHDHGHAHGHAHAHAHDHAHGHDHEHAHEHVHVHKPKPTKKPRKLTETIDMWWQAIVATLLISAAPFAILVQSGCDKKKAMWLQLSTATGAMAGCIIGLLAESASGTAWILPFTAGGFVYIATVSVIPELLKDTTDIWQTVKEIAAMLMGIGMMVIIAMLEH